MFVGVPVGYLLPLIASCMIGALIVHRIANATPPIRRMTPDWVSWDKRIFPFGLALSSILVIYLVAACWPQV